MKKVEVCFEHVRDCPNWADGECLHSEGHGWCYNSTLAFPPDHCPIPDEPTSGAVELGTTPNNESAAIALLRRWAVWSLQRTDANQVLPPFADTIDLVGSVAQQAHIS